MSWFSHAVHSVTHVVTKAATTVGSGVKTAGEATGKGLETAGKATGKGLETAGKATGKGLETGMTYVGKGMNYPGQWINDQLYDIDGKKNTLKNLISEIKTHQTTAKSNHTTLQSNVDHLKRLVISNSALVVMQKLVVEHDSGYDKLVNTIHQLPALTATAVSAKTETYVTAGISNPLVIKGVYNFSQLVKSKYFQSPEDSSADTTDGTPGADETVDTNLNSLADLSEETGVSVAEGGTEAGVEAGAEVAGESALDAAASLSGLETLGIGLAVAELADTVIAVVNGKKEEEQLEKQISKAQDTLTKIENYCNTQTKQITKTTNDIHSEIDRANKVIDALVNIFGKFPASFAWQRMPRYTSTESSIESIVSFISDVTHYYQGFVDFRGYWVNYLNNCKQSDTTPSKAFFKSQFGDFSPVRLSDAQFDRCWEVLQKYSESITDATRVIAEH